jgi:hypothetical protein
MPIWLMLPHADMFEAIANLQFYYLRIQQHMTLYISLQVFYKVNMMAQRQQRQ